MSGEERPITLKVMDAYTRDIGRGVARIDNDTMDMLNASIEDYVEIQNSAGQRVIAKILPLYPQDESKQYIRLDTLTRRNGSLTIDDKVTIRRVASANHIQRLVITPAADLPPIDEEYISDAMSGIAVMEGNTILVPYFGGKLVFSVRQIVPTRSVLIVESTEVVIVEDAVLQSPPPGGMHKVAKPVINEDEYPLPKPRVMDSNCLANEHKFCTHPKKCNCACHKKPRKD